MKKAPNEKDQQKSQDIVLKINRNTILVLLLSFVGILLAFNVVKANYLTTSKLVASPSPIQTPKPTPTPTSTPTTTTKKITPTNKPTNTPAPTPTPQPVAQKVQYTVTQGYTTGNFYCYSNSVNTLPNLENQVRLKTSELESCNSLSKANHQICMNSCTLSGTSIEATTAYQSCLSSCTSTNSGSCNSQYDSLQGAKGILSDQIHKICP